MLGGGQLLLVGGLELLGFLQDNGGVLPGDDDDAVRIGQDDVAGIDADAAARDGDVDLTRTLLVGTAGGGAGAVGGEVPFPISSMPRMGKSRMIPAIFLVQRR